MQSLDNTCVSGAFELNGRHVTVTRTRSLPGEPYVLTFAHGFAIYLTPEQLRTIVDQGTALLAEDASDD